MKLAIPGSLHLQLSFVCQISCPHIKQMFQVRPSRAYLSKKLHLERGLQPTTDRNWSASKLIYFQLALQAVQSPLLSKITYFVPLEPSWTPHELSDLHCLSTETGHPRSLGLCAWRWHWPSGGDLWWQSQSGSMKGRFSSLSADFHWRVLNTHQRTCPLLLHTLPRLCFFQGTLPFTFCFCLYHLFSKPKKQKIQKATKSHL